MCKCTAARGRAVYAVSGTRHRGLCFHACAHVLHLTRTHTHQETKGGCFQLQTARSFTEPRSSVPVPDSAAVRTEMATGLAYLRGR